MWRPGNELKVYTSYITRRSDTMVDDAEGVAAFFQFRASIIARPALLPSGVWGRSDGDWRPQLTPPRGCLRRRSDTRILALACRIWGISRAKQLLFERLKRQRIGSSSGQPSRRKGGAKAGHGGEWRGAQQDWNRLDVAP